MQMTAVNYAGFWRRLAAALIDAGAIFIPWGWFCFPVLAACELLAPRFGVAAVSAKLIAWPLTTILFLILYSALTESSAWQATLGKMVVGVRVTDEEGRRLTIGRGFVRAAAKVLTMLTLGLGFAACGLTRRKRALHDLIAGTVVLRGRVERPADASTALPQPL